MRFVNCDLHCLVLTSSYALFRFINTWYKLKAWISRRLNIQLNVKMEYFVLHNSIWFWFITIKVSIVVKRCRKKDSKNWLRTDLSTVSHVLCFILTEDINGKMPNAVLSSFDSHAHYNFLNANTTVFQRVTIYYFELYKLKLPWYINRGYTSFNMF